MVLATQVEQVIPLPSHQEVTTYAALPSVSHPSDHIALICDLRWNPWSQTSWTKETRRTGQPLAVQHIGFGIYFIFSKLHCILLCVQWLCSSYNYFLRNTEKNKNHWTTNITTMTCALLCCEEYNISGYNELRTEFSEFNNKNNKIK